MPTFSGGAGMTDVVRVRNRSARFRNHAEFIAETQRMQRVIPAPAGIQNPNKQPLIRAWMPASAGMT
jgi:hypothetical protein